MLQQNKLLLTVFTVQSIEGLCEWVCFHKVETDHPADDWS